MNTRRSTPTPLRQQQSANQSLSRRRGVRRSSDISSLAQSRPSRLTLISLLIGLSIFATGFMIGTHTAVTSSSPGMKNHPHVNSMIRHPPTQEAKTPKTNDDDVSKEEVTIDDEELLLRDPNENNVPNEKDPKITNDQNTIEEKSQPKQKQQLLSKKNDSEDTLENNDPPPPHHQFHLRNRNLPTRNNRQKQRNQPSFEKRKKQIVTPLLHRFRNNERLKSDHPPNNKEEEEERDIIERLEKEKARLTDPNPLERNIRNQPNTKRTSPPNHGQVLHPPDKTNHPTTNYFFASKVDWLSLPFIPDNSDGISIFAWIYLHKTQTPRQSRTLLATKQSGCEKNLSGYKLYINREGLADEELVLEYARKRNGCIRVSTVGRQVPILQWVFVGMTLDAMDGPKLYLDGEMVEEDLSNRSYDRIVATVDDDKDLEEVVSLGRSLEMDSPLNGRIAMLTIAKGVTLGPDVVKRLFETERSQLESVVRDVEIESKCAECIFALYPCREEKRTNETKSQLLETLHQNHGTIFHNYRKFKHRTYTPPGGDRYSEYKDGQTPTIITPQQKEESDNLARIRRDVIRNATKHAWDGYKQYAFGKDELKPLSKTGNDVWGGMGTTLVDSLDTLWLVGMKEEFWEGRDWVRDRLNFLSVSDVSVFETTIRNLGGLLAAYDWSGDEVFLERAEDLGRRLLKAFDTPSGFPYARVSLRGLAPKVARRVPLALSEVGSLQLEFRHLAKLTHKRDFADKVNKIFRDLADKQPDSGLFPNQLVIAGNQVSIPDKGQYKLGATGDSFYEYLLKTWLQNGKQETYLRQMYDKAMDGVHELLVKKSDPSGLTYIAEKKPNGEIWDKMDHLVCFMAGSLALGAYTHPDGLESEKAQRDLKTGKALAYTCYQMYARSETGLSGEIVNFHPGQDFITTPTDSFYILRPETVESFFILHKLTGDPIYREWGWEIFQAIDGFCRAEVAYGSFRNIHNPNLPPDDRMESFFLAETLKYLYLLFDPDTEVDILNTHVFNTEAHPLRMFPVLDRIEATE